MSGSVVVLIPTLGRVAQLERCLASIAQLSRLPDRVVVVAQGRHDEVAGLQAGFRELRIHVVRDDGRGRGRALNRGLDAVNEDFVLITDDDCTVDPEWVTRGLAGLAEHPRAIVTGRVMARGEPHRVPSLMVDPQPRELNGPDGFGRLKGGNMAARRSELLALGGFDERVVPTAEDNDLCYRWLQTGGTLRYDPTMVVWHDDWRTLTELRTVYGRYGQGQGVFYGLRLKRDSRFAALVARDLLATFGLWARMVRSRTRPADEPRSAWLPGMILGLIQGLSMAPRDQDRRFENPWLRSWLRSRLANLARHVEARKHADRQR